MAGSHQIAIAKASLSASLLRADPTPVSRDEITNFHNLLDKSLTICSTPNIQVDHKPSIHMHMAEIFFLLVPPKALFDFLDGTRSTNPLALPDRTVNDGS
jgi:hypothetical protein